MAPAGLDVSGSGLPGDLARARVALLEAERTVAPDDRFLAGHLAALRVAAVVLALGSCPERMRRPRNAWRAVAEIAPGLAGWASFYAASEDRRDAVRGGRTGVVSAVEADELVRGTERFLDLVDRALTVRSQVCEPAAGAGRR
ncbi:SAV_6107 family HEPN domain-containing protein [uncultured Friedmanniella sp.]|uniref:SAV_6107 family HEPN domain-containing protein n=1 Tax=uncultured Friedmanniella sp. TaxID=335381 RepID=UPI0035CC8E97